jgi:hypothetical protein
MSKIKFLIFVSLILALPVVAWSTGDAIAQEKVNRAVTIEQARKEVREQVRKDIAAKKGKVSIDDQAKFLGKATRAEQKAAAMRARQLGLYPGVAGLAVQAPVTAPAVQAP